MIPWTCPHCNFSTTVAPHGKVHCVCQAISTPQGELVVLPQNAYPPSIVQRGYNYAKAWTKWRLAGSPTRSPEAVEELRSICKGCPHFNGEICTHKQCGCPVADPGVFGDKLSWETESCPVGKW